MTRLIHLPIRRMPFTTALTLIPCPITMVPIHLLMTPPGPKPVPALVVKPTRFAMIRASATRKFSSSILKPGSALLVHWRSAAKTVASPPIQSIGPMTPLPFAAPPHPIPLLGPAWWMILSARSHPAMSPFFHPPLIKMSLGPATVSSAPASSILLRLTRMTTWAVCCRTASTLS
jgi:hypothetical protein